MTTEEAAAEALAALGRGDDPATLGAPTLLPAAFHDEPREALARTLGETVAAAAVAAPLGVWTGPVTSPFGVHLLRVRERVPARDPELPEIRGAVAADWEALRREEVAEERYAALEREYRVEIAGGAPVPKALVDARADSFAVRAP